MTDSVTDPEMGLKTEWNRKQMLGLAPDVMTMRATSRLIDVSRWELLGSNEEYLWGLFTRPNNTPHSISIRLKDLGANCPCASVKHPCKFTIALLTLYTVKPDQFKKTGTPVWVAQQFEKVGRKAAAKEGVAAKTVVKEAQNGMAEFGRWLRDQVRHGLASFGDQTMVGLEAVANRLIDGHMPQIAEELRALAIEVAPRKGARPVDWPKILLKGYGRFYLLTQAWERFDQLGSAEQFDLIQSCLSAGITHGWQAETQFEVIPDNWLILGRRFEPLGRQWSRRTWLWGIGSNRFALQTEAVYGKNRLVQNLVTGQAYSGHFRFEPGTLGASGRFEHSPQTLSQVAKAGGAEQATDLVSEEKRFIELQTKNPWLNRIPVRLNQIRLQYEDGRDRWVVVDDINQAVYLVNGKAIGWHLLANSQGQPVDVFGEWSNAGITLLSVNDKNRWIDLSVWGSRL